MLYKYETHCHTSQVSRCAKSTGAEMARKYKEIGYTGIIVKAKDKDSLLDAMKNAILNKYDVMTLSNNCQIEAMRYDIDNLDIDKLLN